MPCRLCLQCRLCRLRKMCKLWRPCRPCLTDTVVMSEDLTEFPAAVQALRNDKRRGRAPGLGLAAQRGLINAPRPARHRSGTIRAGLGPKP